MKIPNNIKMSAIAVIPLLSSLVLFVFVGRFGISKIASIRDQISKASSDQKTLTQKVDIVSAVAPSASGLSSSAATALPDANTTLAVFAQIKNLSASQGLIVTNMKSGSEIKDPSGLSRIDTSFEVDGTSGQIVSLLKGISNLAPLMKVFSVKMSGSAGLAKANVVVSSYWSELPKTIPAETQAFSDLTDTEKELLSNISSLTPPVFLTVPPNQVSGKANPFSE